MKTEISIRGGSNLKYIRHQRGMSSSKLAAMMAERFGSELSESAISRYESGDRPLTQELIVQFASCLDCSVATLMDGLDLGQPQPEQVQELRKLPAVVHQIFHWAATAWHGNIVALSTAFGLYAATPGRYRKHAMMELLNQVDKAVSRGDMHLEDVPECIRQGIPELQDLLGGLYHDSEYNG